MNIVWFRQDLRTQDNPALDAAIAAGSVLAIYILDDEQAGEAKMGSASRVWLHHALSDLDRSLDHQLRLFKGNALNVLEDLCQQYSVNTVYWNRCYEPWQIARDKKIKQRLQERDININSYNGSLLWEPWQVLKQDQTPYRVYTPYRKATQKKSKPRRPLRTNSPIQFASETVSSLSLAQLDLLPSKSWHQAWDEQWTMTEQGAHTALNTFLEQGLPHYSTGRDFPAKPYTSRLSPYLHFGQISPNQVWYASLNNCHDDQLVSFQSELVWREFSYYQLYHFPQLPERNLQEKFDYFPWQWGGQTLTAWQKGLTGYPFVDAGMRELWQTGFMHNRVRMVVGSFLVKNLLLHWREGEVWFWDCLLDADLASNSAGWQWVAGSGVDAAPFFRIFNPVTQGEKFDKTGEYTRRFVPELAKLPDKYLHQPWTAPQHILQRAGVVLGQNYPNPVVDLAVSRQAALNAWNDIKTIKKGKEP